MNAALLSLALLGSQPVIHVSDHVPKLNVEALCKQTTDVDNSMRLSEAQSFKDCLRDETAAQQQLAATWMTAPGSVRDSCEGEATLVGLGSYVDLLTCIQMAGFADPAASAAPLRGASKNRNPK